MDFLKITKNRHFKVSGGDGLETYKYDIVDLYPPREATFESTVMPSNYDLIGNYEHGYLLTHYHSKATKMINLLVDNTTNKSVLRMIGNLETGIVSFKWKVTEIKEGYGATVEFSQGENQSTNTEFELDKWHTEEITTFQNKKNILVRFAIRNTTGIYKLSISDIYCDWEKPMEWKNNTFILKPTTSYIHGTLVITDENQVKKVRLEFIGKKRFPRDPEFASTNI